MKKMIISLAIAFIAYTGCKQNNTTAPGPGNTEPGDKPKSADTPNTTNNRNNANMSNDSGNNNSGNNNSGGNNNRQRNTGDSTDGQRRQ